MNCRECALVPTESLKECYKPSHQLRGPHVRPFQIVHRRGVLLVAYPRPNEKPEEETRSTITKSRSYTKVQAYSKERLDLCAVENFGPGGPKDKVIKIK